MTTTHPMMTRDVRTTQRGVRCLFVQLDGSAVAGGTATTNGILVGFPHFTVTENGDGDYTFTINQPGLRLLYVSAESTPTDSYVEVTRDSASAFTILQFTRSTAAALANADFDCQIWVSSASDET